ncbi:MAG: hypothetical protein ACLR56_02720 [Oscillospiraceae bacterium]
MVNFSEEKEYTSDSISVKPWDYTILDKDGKMTAKNGNITDSSKTKLKLCRNGDWQRFWRECLL